MKEYKHLGAYALIVKDGEIVLIRKNGGPYDGKLDLPGGSLEFGETPEEALKRELQEELGVELKQCELFDADSVNFEWIHHKETLKWHHIGIFYRVLNYENEIKHDIKIDDRNDDSLGANFYKIKELKKEELSKITILELEKLGYHLK